MPTPESPIDGRAAQEPARNLSSAGGQQQHSQFPCRPIGIDHIAGFLRRAEADPLVKGHGCQQADSPSSSAPESATFHWPPSQNILVVNDPTSFFYPSRVRTRRQPGDGPLLPGARECKGGDAALIRDRAARAAGRLRPPASGLGLLSLANRPGSQHLRCRFGCQRGDQCRVRAKEEIADCQAPAVSDPPLRQMVRPIVQHVAALAERAQIL